MHLWVHINPVFVGGITCSDAPCGSGGLRDFLQRRVPQQQTLLFGGKTHLRHGLIAGAFQSENSALTELGVAHRIAHLQLRNFLALMHP